MIDNNKVTNAIHINTIKDLLSLVDLYGSDSRAKEIITELEYIRDNSSVDYDLFDSVIANKREQLRLCPKCNNAINSVIYKEPHGEYMNYFQCSVCGWDDRYER